MNKAKESLKDNMEEILSNLPSEFHEAAKDELEKMSDAVESAPSDSDQISAIKAELVANPSVDENAAAGELKDIEAPKAIEKPTDDETKAEMEAMLAEAKKQ